MRKCTGINYIEPNYGRIQKHQSPSAKVSNNRKATVKVKSQMQLRKNVADDDNGGDV